MYGLRKCQRSNECGLSWYSRLTSFQDQTHAGKETPLPAVAEGEYQGLSVDHLVNDISLHVWNIPRCTFIKVGMASLASCVYD